MIVGTAQTSRARTMTTIVNPARGMAAGLGIRGDIRRPRVAVGKTARAIRATAGITTNAAILTLASLADGGMAAGSAIPKGTRRLHAVDGMNEKMTIVHRGLLVMMRRIAGLLAPAVGVATVVGLATRKDIQKLQGAGGKIVDKKTIFL